MRNLSTSGASGWPLVALGASLWGTDFLLRPALLARPGFTSVRVVLFEHIALAALFLPVLIARRADWLRNSRREWLALIYIAWAGSAAATILLSRAYQLGSPLTATLLQKTQPLFAVALAGIVLRERRTMLFWMLFCAALCASYLLSFGLMNPLRAAISPSAASIGYALAAAMLWGSCTVVGRFALSALAPSLVAAWRFALALPLLVTLSLCSHPAAQTGASAAAFTLTTLLLLGGIVLLPDTIGMVLYYIGLSRAPASLATLAEMAYPAAALLLGAICNHQRLQLGQLFGIIALLACLQLIQSAKTVRVAPPARAAHLAHPPADPATT